jgi:hypothetical protein
LKLAQSGDDRLCVALKEAQKASAAAFFDTLPIARQ